MRSRHLLRPHARRIHVHVGDLQVSEDPDSVLVTYSLGSCVGLVLYDESRRLAGMLHSMLPLAKLNPERAKERPGMFSDTGVAALLEALFARGARKQSLKAKIMGAASMLDHKGFFRIGERNYAVVRKLLWKNEIFVAAEDVGGVLPRTVHVYPSDGLTVIHHGSEEKQL